jgi:DNA-directed RNA polymerase II subunit RPB1
MVCEGGDELADGTVQMEDYGDTAGNGVMANGGAGKKKSSHGGCGSRQPTIRKDGLKFIATFKSANADVRLLFLCSSTL